MSVIVNKDNTKEFENAFERQLAKALEVVGLTAQNYALQELTELKPHKSGESPRDTVETGRLRDSITHKVMNDEKAVYIGTNVEYAPCVELGTSRAPAYPFLQPAVEKHKQEYRDIIEKGLKGN